MQSSHSSKVVEEMQSVPSSAGRNALCLRLEARLLLSFLPQNALEAVQLHTRSQGEAGVAVGAAGRWSVTATLLGWIETVPRTSLHREVWRVSWHICKPSACLPCVCCVVRLQRQYEQHLHLKLGVVLISSLKVPLPAVRLLLHLTQLLSQRADVIVLLTQLLLQHADVVAPLSKLLGC